MTKATSQIRKPLKVGDWVIDEHMSNDSHGQIVKVQSRHVVNVQWNNGCNSVRGAADLRQVEYRPV